MKAFIYCTKIFKKNMGVTIIMYFFITFILIPLSVGEVLVTQKFINNLEGIYDETVSTTIYWQLMLLFVICLCGYVLSSFKAICETNLQEFGLYVQERILLDKSLHLSIEQLDDVNVKNLRDKAKKFNFAKTVSFYVGFLSNILSFLSFTTILFYYNSYAIIVISLLLILVNMKINKWRAIKVENSKQNQVAERRQASYLFELLTNPKIVQELRITDAWQYLRDKMKVIYNRYMHEDIKVTKVSEIIGTIGELLFVIVSVISMISLVYIVSKNKYQVGTYVILTQILMQLQKAISGILNTYSNVESYNLQFKQQQMFLQLEEVENNEKYVASNGEGRVSVEFKNVSFKYPKTEKYVLRNINITINAGEKVAIVGDNGAGKSTFIKLLLGLYQPTQGKIIYRKNNEEITCEEVIRETRVVFQDFLKLLRPVRENVGVGDINNVHNNELLVEAMRKANLNYSEEELEKYLGNEFGGEDISGGQWQRLSISRAYMKEGSLLVFDEATAALDPESENKLISNYLELAAGKTSVYITHRLTVTKLMDKIIVLHNGNLIEVGCHQELIEQKAMYYNMYEAQSALYVGKK